ncbi:MAG: hypothetical protein V4550_12170 [Gemmatimonadota bacterium]
MTITDVVAEQQLLNLSSRESAITFSGQEQEKRKKVRSTRRDASLTEADRAVPND